MGGTLKQRLPIEAYLMSGKNNQALVSLPCLVIGYEEPWERTTLA